MNKNYEDKLYDGGLIVFIVVIIACIVGGSSYYFLGPDNPIEEAAEDVIKVETGATVNLNPPNASTQTPVPPSVSGEVVKSGAQP